MSGAGRAEEPPSDERMNELVRHAIRRFDEQSARLAAQRQPLRTLLNRWARAGVWGHGDRLR